MYAIIELGGRQWKVEPGTHLDINRVSNDVGSQLPVEQVLLAHDGSRLHVGRPFVQGAKVMCEVIAHRLGPKEISYHFRRRENWRKTVGHRQPLTRLVVKDILLGDEGVGQVPQEATASERAPKKSASPRARPKKTLSKPSAAR